MYETENDNKKIKYYSKNDNFSVVFPNEPDVKTLNYGIADTESSVTSYMSSDGYIIYFVAINKLGASLENDEDRKTYVDNLLYGIGQAYENFGLIYQKDIEYRSFPAIEYKFKYKFKNVAMFQRGVYFLRNSNELIKIALAYPPSDEEKYREKYIEFIDSLELKINEGMEEIEM